MKIQILKEAMIFIPPGNIEIKVYKEGYNSISKEIEVKSGENKINIELI